jgi:hypothetical protein
MIGNGKYDLSECLVRQRLDIGRFMDVIIGLFIEFKVVAQNGPMTWLNRCGSLIRLNGARIEKC